MVHCLEKSYVPLLTRCFEQREPCARLQRLQDALAYTFQHPSLLRLATTHAHSSERPGGDYKALEFLGDAVLCLLATHYIYVQFPTLDEGTMSPLRAILVSNRFLARCFCRTLPKANLSLVELLGLTAEPFVGDPLQQVGCTMETFQETVRETSPNLDFHLAQTTEPPDTHGQTCGISGHKIFADVYEAIIGSLFLDTGGQLQVNVGAGNHDNARPYPMSLRLYGTSC